MSGAAEWMAEPDAISLPADAVCMSEAEFNDFYRGTSRGLKAYLLRLCEDSAQADDLLQESYFRMLRSGLPPLEQSQRKSYLYRVATNLARDHFRRRKFDAGPIDESTPLPSTAADPMLGPDIRRILSDVAPKERELVWLAYVEGASHREIAEVTGLKEASVRPMLYRVRQKLATMLRERGWHHRGRSNP